MLGPLWRALDTARRGPGACGGPGALERSVAAHRRILSAVAGRDPAEARTAMADHLASVEAELRANPPDPDLPHVDEHRAA
jgi:DNA-binding FadR family transcriptional regulator